MRGRFRGVAQVVERFVRDEEAASSSLVTPIKYLSGFPGFREPAFSFFIYFSSTIFDLFLKKLPEDEVLLCDVVS